MDAGAHASPANARKRKHSVVEAGDTERVIKHRSSQACQACRNRKVSKTDAPDGARGSGNTMRRYERYPVLSNSPGCLLYPASQRACV